MNTSVWGSNPPQYEQYSDGTFRVYFNPVPFDRVAHHHNEETGEDEEVILPSFKVNYTVLNSPLLTQAVNDKNEFLINKILLTERIKGYDSSDEVNSFTVQGVQMWLDKNTRAGLQLRFSAEIASGLTTTTLWYGNLQIPLDLQTAQQMLYALERYASACYDCTQQHLANVENLTFAEDFINYDYRANYPEKLVF